MYMKGRGFYILFQIMCQLIEFENSCEYWRVFRYYDRVVIKLEVGNKIIESGFLIEIVRSLDKLFEDNGF